MIIDTDKSKLPACPWHRVARIPCDAMADFEDASKFLGVNVQQISRMFALVANGKRRRIEARQARKSRARQRAADGCATDLQFTGNLRHRPAPASKAHDALGCAFGNSSRRVPGPATGIAKPFASPFFKAAHPLAHRLAVNPE